MTCGHRASELTPELLEDLLASGALIARGIVHEGMPFTFTLELATATSRLRGVIRTCMTDSEPHPLAPISPAICDYESIAHPTNGNAALGRLVERWKEKDSHFATTEESVVVCRNRNGGARVIPINHLHAQPALVAARTILTQYCADPEPSRRRHEAILLRVMLQRLSAITLSSVHRTRGAAAYMASIV